MGKVVNIAPVNEDDWRKSPLMRDLMEKDKIRAAKVLKKYNMSLKNPAPITKHK